MFLQISLIVQGRILATDIFQSLSCLQVVAIVAKPVSEGVNFVFVIHLHGDGLLVEQVCLLTELFAYIADIHADVPVFFLLEMFIHEGIDLLLYLFILLSYSRKKLVHCILHRHFLLKIHFKVSSQVQMSGESGKNHLEKRVDGVNRHSVITVKHIRQDTVRSSAEVLGQFSFHVLLHCMQEGIIFLHGSRTDGVQVSHDALFHLSCGFLGECHRQYAVKRLSLHQESNVACGQSEGLSRPGRGAVNQHSV